jgi:Na+/H+-dicarboxylate symporter
MNRAFFSNITILVAVIVGVISGWWGGSSIFAAANVTSDLFLRLLKLIAMPVVFLSLVSSISSMKGMAEVRSVGRRVLFYTLLTTIIAAFVALIIFLIVKPVHNGLLDNVKDGGNNATIAHYLSFLKNIIPDNFFGAFIDNNVLSVAFLGVTIGISILCLKEKERRTLNHFFSSLFSVVLKITKLIVFLMPVGVWAFVTIFVNGIISGQMQFDNLILYIICIVGANIFQGIVVLPIFLMIKGFSPSKMMRGMYPALIAAFCTKSSNAALPIAMQCSIDRLKVPKRIVNISFPLCSVINMNGCAAFILTSVLFVSMSCGYVYSISTMIMLVFLASIAAVGNAGVPMGCYFLTCAFLSSMNVPLELMGFILPIYTIVDMVETTLNIWSDSCVTAVVAREEVETVVTSELCKES